MADIAGWFKRAVPMSGTGAHAAAEGATKAVEAQRKQVAAVKQDKTKAG